MYLAVLSNDKKHLFLDLELYMSKVDGEFSEEEKQIIDTHCLEMRIDNNNYENEYSIDELFCTLKNSLTVQEAHIFFLELAATVLADNAYHVAEKKLLNQFASVLSIPENEVEEAILLIKRIKCVYEDCANYIKE